MDELSTSVQGSSLGSYFTYRSLRETFKAVLHMSLISINTTCDKSVRVKQKFPPANKLSVDVR